MRTAVVVVALLGLAGCGGPAFDGTFTGAYQGQEATLVLETDGERLGGTIRWAGVEAAVTGEAKGDSASGSVRQAAMGVELPFEAKLDGDTIAWTYRIANPYTGQTETLPLTFTRGEKRAAAPSGGGSAKAGLDPGLVGRWYTEVGGSQISGHSAMTRIHVTLLPDGTFQYGGADTLITLRDSPLGPGDTGGVLDAGTTRGQWKSEGGVLSYQATGSPQWIPLGRYQLSGSTDLMLTTADGGKQLWSRE